MDQSVPISAELARLGREMSTEEATCPACGSDAHAPFVTRNAVPVVACRDCGTLYARMRPPEALLKGLYERFTQLSNGREGRVDDDPADGAWEAACRLQRLLPHASSGHLLDLGCGRGDFLLAARNHFDVHGVDIVPRLRPSAGSLPVHAGRLEDAGYPDGMFDVVTAVEVLEHLFDCRRTVREIGRILKPGGLLLLQTGDADSLRARLNPETWTYLQPPVHLNVFSRKGLRCLAADSAFDPVAAWSFGRAPVKMPILVRLWEHAAFRPVLDAAAHRGLLGEMQLWRRR